MKLTKKLGNSRLALTWCPLDYDARQRGRGRRVDKNTHGADPILLGAPLTPVIISYEGGEDWTSLELLAPFLPIPRVHRSRRGCRHVNEQVDQSLLKIDLFEFQLRINVY